jgi:hypothetical protein
MITEMGGGQILNKLVGFFWLFTASIDQFTGSFICIWFLTYGNKQPKCG